MIATLGAIVTVCLKVVIRECCVGGLCCDGEEEEVDEDGGSC